MNLKDRLQLAWKNKGQIAEGFFNAFVSCSEDVKAEAMKRLTLCRSNECGLYNPKGENTDILKAVFPGKESCGGCGCDLYAKAHAMSAHCYLRDLQVTNFRLLINEGYIETLIESGKVKTEDASFFQNGTLSNLADNELWLLLQTLKSKGIEPPVGMAPLWEDVLTLEQEMQINEIAYKKQFENRK